jgi:thioredoxin-dependent peroxiredoxin
MLNAGDPCPSFEVRASDGTLLKLEDFRGHKNVILYFYPKDFTGICTKETCGFRDLLAKLGTDSTQVIGVSADSDESHIKFAAEYNVQFPLVADPKKVLAKRFDAAGGLMGVLGMTKRITFVIDKESKIAGVIEGAMSADKHVEGVRALLAQLS